MTAVFRAHTSPTILVLAPVTDHTRTPVQLLYHYAARRTSANISTTRVCLHPWIYRDLADTFVLEFLALGTHDSLAVGACHGWFLEGDFLATGRIRTPKQLRIKLYFPRPPIFIQFVQVFSLKYNLQLLIRKLTPITNAVKIRQLSLLQTLLQIAHFAWATGRHAFETLFAANYISPWLFYVFENVVANLTFKIEHVFWAGFLA